MTRQAGVLKALLADLAKLRRPVTAAAVAAEIAVLIAPFGLNVGPDGSALVGILAGVGLVAGYVEHLRSA